MPRRKTTDKEIKSARTSIILTPSLYKAADLLADSQGLTFNKLVTFLLERAVKKNRAVIENFAQERANAQKNSNFDLDTKFDSDKSIFTAKNVDFDRNELEEEDALN